MNTFTIKTYEDSYLYNNKVSRKDSADPKKNTDKAIRDFIISSTRIDNKQSEAFRGIIESIKRQQRSSIFLTVLMMDSVKLCINGSEMPRAFKVFDAKDPKDNKKNNVFIDVTGLIEFNNGYYYCKKVDVLCAYLMDALVYLLYRRATSKVLDNSTITQAACSCYVAMFDYILDYLRIARYSSNKNKISYLVALFFLHTMMGKELDQYTKQIAANIANISASDIAKYDLYIEDDAKMLDNINVFINELSSLFGLNDFTLEVFVSKWMYIFGTGTQYATELYTSFLCLILMGYSGAYIVNQKQIERCCNLTIMGKLWNSIEKAGIGTFDMRGRMNESALKIYERHDRSTMELKDQIEARNNLFKEDIAITKKDFLNRELLADKLQYSVKYLRKANLPLNKLGTKAIKESIDFMVENTLGSVKDNNPVNDYCEGTVAMLCKAFRKELALQEASKMIAELDKGIGLLRDVMEDGVDDSVTELIGKSISELIDSKNELNK